MAKFNFDIACLQGIDEAKNIISEEITKNNGEIQINGNKREFTISVPGGEVTGSMAFENNTISVSM